MNVPRVHLHGSNGLFRVVHRQAPCHEELLGNEPLVRYVGQPFDEAIPKPETGPSGGFALASEGRQVRGEAAQVTCVSLRACSWLPVDRHLAGT